MRKQDIKIEIQNCHFGYHKKGQKNILLEDISLMAFQGELIALIGKNGSGKTTFLRTLTGLQQLLEGKISIEQKNVSDFHANELARKVGFVSTFIPDNPEMTVEELVRIGRYPYTNFFGVLRLHDIHKVKEAIDICGIKDLQGKKISEISDGERQRTMLARVFAQDTDIILLDEPTSFLDIPNKFDIFNLLGKLSKEGKIIIFTTHDLNLATRYADKIWLIKGRSVAEGAPEDLFLGTEMREQFVSDKLTIDPETGEIGPKFHPGKSLILHVGKDCELAEIWTKRAFARRGIVVLCDENEAVKDSVRVFISKEKNKYIWNLQKENQNLFLTSIYLLINQLENSISHELN